MAKSMHVIYPKGKVAIPQRRRSTEANAVYTICKALDEAGYLFDQEVSIGGCRFDIVVYVGESAKCVIEVKRNIGGVVASRQRRLYAQFGVPVILAKASDVDELLRFLAGQVVKQKAIQELSVPLPFLRLLRKPVGPKFNVKFSTKARAS